MKQSNILTWKHTIPTCGPVYYKGYLGKVHLFSIGTCITARTSSMYLRSVLFPKQGHGYAGSHEVLKAQAEDRARQMLEAMGLTSNGGSTTK